MSIVCHNYALYSIHKPERKTGFGFMDTKRYCEFITCPHYIPKKNTLIWLSIIHVNTKLHTLHLVTGHFKKLKLLLR